MTTTHLKNRYKILPILTCLLLPGCGSLTPALETGQGFYSELPKSEVSRMVNTNQIKTSTMKTEAYGCFALDPAAIDKEIIEPAVKKSIIESNAFAAKNVKARRQMAPTILDALAGAVIWGCSYWDITGDLLQSSNNSP